MNHVRPFARMISTSIGTCLVTLLAITVGAGVLPSWNAVSAHAATLTVNTTSTVIDFAGARQVSDLPGPDGLVTFPEAAIASSNSLGPDLIAFNIPLSDPGLLAGSFRIDSDGFITLEDDETTVDGTTQTLFTGDTSAGPEIWLFGNIPMSMSAPGILIRSNRNRVTGIGGFHWFKHGISIEGNENVVTGCTTVQVLNYGILVTGANNLIGGTTPAARNLLSLCGSSGITITSAGATGNIVRGNFIGTTITGDGGLGNHSAGVVVNGGASGTTIGGTGVGEGNVISSSGHLGDERVPTGTQIDLAGDHNAVLGNLIGTDFTGTVVLAGANSSGINVTGSWNTIGAPGAGNVISGHPSGIRLSGGRQNVIQANRIGTDVSGALPLPNARGIEVAMISFSDLVRESRIGGAGPGEGNRIAYNQKDGIIVASSGGVGPTGVTVSRNAMYSNGELGVNLMKEFYGYPATVTANDAGDADSGPNELQNFPLLTSAVDNGIATTVTGTVDTSLPESATIELFSNSALDPSGFGEGADFVGTATPSPSGNFVAMLSTGLAGKFITATATDASGNTSEFSAGIVVQLQTTAVDPSAERAGRWLDVHPNPASAAAGIRFHLPAAEYASITVFDVRGRSVRSLAERRLFEPGLHEFRWRGDDDRGRSVPSGVYFLRLDGAAGVEVHKLLLAR